MSGRHCPWCAEDSARTLGCPGVSVEVPDWRAQAMEWLRKRAALTPFSPYELEAAIAALDRERERKEGGE